MTSPDSPATPPTPPAPLYGEYASPEHAEAARLAQLPAAAQPAPTQPQTQPPAPYTPAPYGQQQPYVQQPYGQQPYSPQPYGQQPSSTGERPQRTGDMIASIVLLAVGFFATIYATLNALSLTMQFQLLYEDNGVSSSYEPSVGASVATVVIIASHAILLAVAALVTVTLIRKRRVSFWVPLVAGAIAFVIFFGCILAVVLSDANLMEAITRQSQL